MLNRWKNEELSILKISENDRLALLNRQISHAVKNSRFYEERWGTITLLSSFSELAYGPFLRETDLIEHGTQLVCVPGSEVQRIVSAQTSGTSGTRKRLFFTENDLERTVQFFEEGMGRMCKCGDRVAVLLPTSSPGGLSDLLVRALKTIGTQPRLYPVYEDDTAVINGIAEQKPDVIVGYPWYVRFLSLKYPALKPRVVLLSADYVPELLKKELGKIWSSSVLTHYGLTETCYGCAVEQPYERDMFLRKQDLYAEIIDEKTGFVLPPGRKGELVLTTLQREAMPLLRYRTGDIAELTPEGNIAHVFGRCGKRRKLYEQQERLSCLPWLFDYLIAGDIMSAEVSSEFPEDGKYLLQEITGCSKIDLLLETKETARPLLKGKRQGE